jgi:PTH1 family peptidyl-tRNA hydrolase
MKVVVGIGNPGKDYERTRHNVGFRVADELGRRTGIVCSKRRFHSRVGGGTAWGKRLLLVKPQTFVNESGLAVAEAVRWYSCELSHLLLVCDDFQLPLGQIRIRRKGSAGGHKGLASVIEALGTTEFARLRLGIAGAGGKRDEEFVLSTFEAGEEVIVTEMVKRAADAVSCWLQDGIERAMNLFNKRLQQEECEPGKEEEGA